jgi:hypothetical protein
VETLTQEHAVDVQGAIRRRVVKSITRKQYG